MSSEKPNPRSTYAQLPETSWLLLNRIADATSQQRQVLLNQLLDRYWKALYAYYRSKGQSRSDAEDLVQGLLLKLPQQATFPPQQERTTRFRAWLLQCARNHLVDTLRKNQAEKRKPDQPILSFKQSRDEVGGAFEPADGADPDHVFHDAWRRSLVERALAAVGALAESAGRSQDYDIFLEYYYEAESPTWQQLADKYDLENWKNAVNKADWIKRRMSDALREEVLGYVSSEDEVDDEFRDLLK